MKIVYVDITELESWQGRLTGVPRVMDELSSRFKEHVNVIFVKWTSGYFVTVNYTEIRNALANANLLMGINKDDSSLKRKVRGFFLCSKSGRLLVALVRRVHKRSTLTETPSNAVNIQTGDALLVLADWHGSDSDFIAAILDLKKKKVFLAQIVYDMLPIVTPQYSGHSTATLKDYSKQIYPLCDLLFSISEYTKRDIVQWLKVNSLHIPKIVVIRLGDDFGLAKPAKPKNENFNEMLKINENFVLCVGTIEARKNHALLYYVYKLAKQKHFLLPKLVIVGRLGWLSADIFDIMTHDPETKESFIFLNSASDEELSWLYQHCQMTIYPSFYEGWGLPVAESIAYGAPCIASNTSSMPEIAGELINYFSPSSTDECLQAIAKLLNPVELAKAKQKISKYKPTTWNETANQVYDHIRSVFK